MLLLLGDRSRTWGTLQGYDFAGILIWVPYNFFMIPEHRGPKTPAPSMFEHSPHEIAWKKEDVTEHTRAYVGSLFPGIFKILGHLEHIYTSFPEGEITRHTIDIGGKTAKQLEKELEKKGFMISDYARFMMKKKESAFQKNPEKAHLVRLKVKDFGFTKAPTMDEIYTKAEELGLELCSAEVGSYLRLQYADQPIGEWFLIAMEQILDPDGDLNIFDLERDDDAMWLLSYSADPGDTWGPDGEFVFRLRK
jgi:hypothetical protein